MRGGKIGYHQIGERLGERAETKAFENRECQKKISPKGSLANALQNMEVFRESCKHTSYFYQVHPPISDRIHPPIIVPTIPFLYQKDTPVVDVYFHLYLFQVPPPVVAMYSHQSCTSYFNMCVIESALPPPLVIVR